MRFSRWEKRIIHAIYDTMYPSGASERLPEGIAGGDVAGFIDELADAWGWLPVATLRIAVVFVFFASFALAPSLKPFQWLPEAKRLRVLERLYASDVYVVRQMITMLKATAGFLYGAMVRPKIAPTRGPAEPQALIALQALRRAKTSNNTDPQTTERSA
ncbi:MAG: hypothetical protein Q8Q09_04055 [Deltaproteobacteria bacterium]|nr:hypothetical protein [Deltaproteobacteria bacterium]